MTLRRLIGNLKWLWLWLWFLTAVWPETLSRNMYPCVPIIWNVCFRFKICTQSWLANLQYVSKTILSHTKYASSCTCTTNEFSIYRGTLHLLLLQILEWNVVWCFAGSKILSPGSRHGKSKVFCTINSILCTTMPSAEMLGTAIQVFVVENIIGLIVVWFSAATPSL